MGCALSSRCATAPGKRPYHYVRSEYRAQFSIAETQRRMMNAVNHLGALVGAVPTSHTQQLNRVRGAAAGSPIPAVRTTRVRAGGGGELPEEVLAQMPESTRLRFKTWV